MENTNQSVKAVENNIQSTGENKVYYSVQNIVFNRYETDFTSSSSNEYVISEVHHEPYDDNHIQIFFTRSWKNWTTEDVVIKLEWDGRFSFEDGDVLKVYYDLNLLTEEDMNALSEEYLDKPHDSEETLEVERDGVYYQGHFIEKLEVNNVTYWRFVVGYCQIGGCDLVYRTCATLEQAQTEIVELDKSGFVPESKGACSDCRAELYGDDY